jgi:hypothetical protein
MLLAALHMQRDPSTDAFQLEAVVPCSNFLCVTPVRYALTCCSWFAKDFPRLLAAKAAHNWDPYDVEELRGKTMGIVGYGDIGQATARLAKAFKMHVVALRRNTQLTEAEQAEGVVVSAIWHCALCAWLKAVVWCFSELSCGLDNSRQQQQHEFPFSGRTMSYVSLCRRSCTPLSSSLS